MRNYLQLAQLNAGNQAVDFAPIGNALETYRQQNNQNALMQRRDEEMSYQRGRDQQQDARVAKDDMRSTVDRLGKMAVAGQALKDPAQQSALLERIIAEHPNAAGLGPEYRDPKTAFGLIAAEAGQWRDPREDQLMDLKVQGARADLQNAQRGKAPDLQEVYTDTGGKQKGYFQNGQFVPVGGVAAPRSEQLTAADRKAILEADDKTQANASAISTLNQALDLNKRANAGWGAGVRSSIANNLPDLLVPDMVSSPESGQAAAELDNAIIGNALEQLKATFGGMPTEGERKILIDIQGSINQPREVREAIYRRALNLAQQRLEVNRQEAEKLRGGTYYKPGGAAALPNQQAQPAPAPARVMDIGDGFQVEVND